MSVVALRLSSPHLVSGIASSSSGVIGTGTFQSSLAQTAGSSAYAAATHEMEAQVARNQSLLAQARAARSGGTNATVSGGAAANSYDFDLAQMSAQNAAMLQVQMAMQRENTLFTSISNILKTKHDTLKNTVSNIR